MSTDGNAAPGDIPPKPVPKPSELLVGAPFALLEAGRNTVGWQKWPEDKGGPGFATLRRSALGVCKFVNRYPMTDEGWAQAWQEITTLEAAIVPRLRGVLAQRIEDEARLSSVPAEPVEPQVPARSSPEVRARILEMFKRGNNKYAKPFEQNRLAILSVMGGNWEEYGKVVLQMAILDTLLSIEELLTKANDDSGKADQNEAEQP